MQKTYPHIDDTNFPNLNTVDTYKYKNEYDYDLYTDSVKIKLLNVPWCGDYDNVVYFESKEKRDEWFDNKVNEDGSPVKEISSSFRLYKSGEIKVDLPIDECMEYNYVMIDYGKLPQQNKLSNNHRIFYFIDDLFQDSVNSTRLSLSVDYWTTYINDIDFSYVMLNRGHAPVNESNVDSYLDDPINNCQYLLTPDVNYGGEPDIVKTIDNYNFDSENRYAVVCTCFDITKSYGNSSTPSTPGLSSSFTQGMQSPSAYAMSIGDIERFLIEIDNKCPWIKQMIKGMFFIPSNFVSVEKTVDFLGFTLSKLNANSKVVDLNNLTKDQFGFDKEFDKFAKLYTFPYSCIRVEDANGNISTIRIENTKGKVSASVSVSLVLPYISIDVSLLNIGGASNSLAFYNSEGRTYNYGGDWGSLIKKFDVPVMNVYQPLPKFADYNTKYSRTQQNNDALTSRDNANSSALTSKTNSDASVNTSTLNSKDSINTSFNNDIDSLNNGKNNISLDVAKLNRIYDLTKETNQKLTNLADNISILSGNADLSLKLASVALEINNMVTAGSTSAIQTMLSGGAGAVDLVGNFIDVSLNAVNVNTGVSNNITYNALASVAQGYKTLLLNGGNTTVSNELKSDIDNITKQFSSIDGFDNRLLETLNTLNGLAQNTELGLSKQKTNMTLDLQNKINKENTSNMTAKSNNNYNTGVSNSNRSKNTGIANADRSNTTSLSNNERAYNNSILNNNRSYNNTLSGIENSLNQNSLGDVVEFGVNTNMQNSSTRPKALFTSIVTQNKNAIKSAASQFARYGYKLGQQWNITNLQVMKHFTYWKCDEVWISSDSSNVFEGAQNMIKNIMINGVTVWSKPEEIGKISIFEN